MIQLRRSGPDGGEAGGPRFRPGSIVLHRRYHYRAVVVAVDARCLADEAWYQSNQTQPLRDQPWYHTLVDGAAHTTYVAESNLTPDPSGAPIDHPLLEYYFEGYEGESYLRNHMPWGG